MAPTAVRSPANTLVTTLCKAYHPLGFTKGYNALLWFLFSGALLGFVLARFMYLNFAGVFCGPAAGGNHAAPGECFYYLRGHYRVGIQLHLYTILPAASLALLQFVPAVRRGMVGLHRVNGYLVLVLALVSTAGALMMARVAFGGGLAIQAGVGFLAVVFVGALGMAWGSVRRLQIEQHRAWMLRAWFYAGSIITLRIIQIIAAQIVTDAGGYFESRPCAQIASIYGETGSSDVRNATLARYPDCAPHFSGLDPGKQVAVEADFRGDAVGIAVALGANFGMALWLALAMHAVGIEIYLHLTPVEAERLRNVSYQRQLEAGLNPPGRAGLTVDRVGDSERWIPRELRKDKLLSSSGEEGRSSEQTL